MGKRGKPPPVTEAGLVYKSQGNGWEVSLRSKRFDRTQRMVRRRWQPQIFLTTVNHLCGHCPPRVREADLDYRVESSSLQSSLAQRRTACDPVLLHPFPPGSPCHGKRTAPASWHDTAPTFWGGLRHSAAAPWKQQVASRVARSNTGMTNRSDLLNKFSAKIQFFFNFKAIQMVRLIKISSKAVNFSQ